MEPVKILTCRICNKSGHEARYCRTPVQDIKELIVGKRSRKFKQNEKLPFELKVNGISKWNKNSTSTLPFIDIFNPPSNNYGQFMIDTGSEANIIEKHLLPTEIDIKNYKTVLLKEVGDKFQNTMGSIEIAIYGRRTTFLIVTEDFDIPSEGILGVTYLTETGAIIDYGHGTLQIGETIANLKCRKEPSTMNKQQCLLVKKELKNIIEDKTSNSVIINEIQKIPINPAEAENKINSTWSLDTNVFAIPQINIDENQLQDMDEEIPESSNENLSVVNDFKPLELLDLDYSTKPHFQDILNEVSSELNFKNYSTIEVNETFQIFKENYSKSPFVKIYSIENHEITSKETKLLNKLRFEHLNEEEKNIQ